MNAIGRPAHLLPATAPNRVRPVRAPEKSNDNKNLFQARTPHDDAAGSPRGADHGGNPYQNGTSGAVPFWVIRLSAPFVTQLLGQMLPDRERHGGPGYGRTAPAAPPLLDRYV